MKINSSIKNYTIDFKENFEIEHLDYQPGDLIVVDKNVNLPEMHDKNVIQILASESTKSYEYLPEIIKEILDSTFTKHNKLIAIGGGITQDIVSFISSILYRGVDWTFFPTTLLAQGDSCIGGKTSINFREYKNQLGNFNPPNKITVCNSFLETLSSEDIVSGLGEMLHFYLVSGIEDFKFYKDKLGKSNKEIVKRCLEIKKRFVELDEFDKKERLLLNYGHTFGHAIETVTKYEYPHGISVCFGMNIANYISYRMGSIDKNLYLELGAFMHTLHGKRFNIENIDKFIEALKKDKKNLRPDKVRCVLTRGVGDMFLTEVSYSEIEKILNDYKYIH